jgi:hypothetical protein
MFGLSRTIAHSSHLSQQSAGQAHHTGAATIGSPWRRAPVDAFSRKSASPTRLQPVRGRITEAASTTLRHAVGSKIRNKTDQVTVEAEDALVAALKVKRGHPEAAITCARKQRP